VAADSLWKIIDYISEFGSEMTSRKVYDNIMEEIDSLENEIYMTKICEELRQIGIPDVREIVIKPWKVYHRISSGNDEAEILYVADTRRDIQSLLEELVMEAVF
jgi:plasmid stabilization system protein ParE